MVTGPNFYWNWLKNITETVGQREGMGHLFYQKVLIILFLTEVKRGEQYKFVVDKLIVAVAESILRVGYRGRSTVRVNSF